VLTEVLRSADYVLIPFVPEIACAKPTRRTAELVSSLGVPFRVVVNQADPLRGPGPVEAAWKMLDGWGLPRTRSFVRRYVAHSQSQLNGEMITQYRGDKSWRAALDDMRRLQTEVLIELGRLTPAGVR
jgi:MinD superfamily P-loop ATPase